MLVQLGQQPVMRHIVEECLKIQRYGVFVAFSYDPVHFSNGIGHTGALLVCIGELAPGLCRAICLHCLKYHSLHNSVEHYGYAEFTHLPIGFGDSDRLDRTGSVFSIENLCAESVSLLWRCHQWVTCFSHALVVYPWGFVLV